MSELHHNLTKHGSIGDQSLVGSKDMFIDFYHIATGYCVKFKAFIQSIQDQFASNWSPQQVFGRMDPLMTFQNTTRIISLSFSVPSVSLEEGERNLHAIEHLIMQMYPTYISGGIMAGSPLMRIKFANLIKKAGPGHQSPDAKTAGLVAAVQGITFSPDMEPGFYIPSTGKIIPKSFVVDLSFQVLHDEALGFVRAGKWRKKKFSFPYVTNGKEATEAAANCKEGSRVGVGKFTPSNDTLPGGFRESRINQVLNPGTEASQR